MTYRARSWGKMTGGDTNTAVILDAGFAALEDGGTGVELRLHPLGGIAIWMTGGTSDGQPYERLIGVVEQQHEVSGVDIPGFTPGEHLRDATTGWPPVSEDA